jgi:hypothetical protein
VLRDKVPTSQLSLSLTLYFYYVYDGYSSRWFGPNQLAAFLMPYFIKVINPNPHLPVRLAGLAVVSPTPVDITLRSSNVTFQVTLNASHPDSVRGYIALVKEGRWLDRVAFVQVVNASTLTLFNLTVPVARTLAAGTYNLWVELQSNYHNTLSFSSGMLAIMSLPSSIPVVNLNSNDVNAPELVNFTALSPTIVNVTNSDATILYELLVRDDVYGLRYGYVAPEYDYIFFYGPSLVDGQRPVPKQLQRYNCNVTVRKGSRQGVRGVSVGLDDHAGNERSYSRWDMSRLHPTFPSTIQVINSLDPTIPPEVLTFVVSTAVVNVTYQPVNVTVTITAQDNIPGIKNVRVEAQSRSGRRSESQDEVVLSAMATSGNAGRAVYFTFTLAF